MKCEGCWLYRHCFRRHQDRAEDALGDLGDYLLEAAGDDEHTTDALDRQDRRWREHNVQDARVSIHPDDRMPMGTLGDLQRSTILRIARRARVTTRQYDCLEHALSGLTLRGIGATMGISYRTAQRDLTKALQAMRPILASDPYATLWDLLLEVFGSCLRLVDLD